MAQPPVSPDDPTPPMGFGRPDLAPGGPSPGQSGPAAEPAPSRGGSLVRRVAVGVVVAIVALVGGYYLRTLFDAPPNVRAGDCITVVDPGGADPSVTVVDCAGTTATHKVAKNLDSSTATCPGDTYDEYVESGTVGGGFKLCLIPAAQVGDCFTGDGSGPTTKVTCGPGAIEITKVIVGRADEAACGDDLAVTFPEPPTVLCGRASP